jgi:glutathione S-transferase
MIKVYASGDSRSRRVLWACEEVGAPYEVVELQFPPRLHHPEFLALSPAGALPAIEDGDLRLIESLTICEYVSRKHGGTLTVDPGEADYFAYLQFVQFGDATLAPPLAWARRFGPRLPEAMADAQEAFRLRLGVIEQALADGREFLVADRITVADISVGFTLGLSAMVKLHHLVPPAVAAYEERLRGRPAYRRAYGLA